MTEYVNNTSSYPDYAFYLNEDTNFSILEDLDDLQQPVIYPEEQIQNVLVLAAVLLLALTANLVALPVILFRRTKFGNGLFAVLILCLTLADLAVVFFSVLGSLIVEASHLLWGGTSGSCQIYHFFSAWVTAMSAYLLVSIIAMVMVKTTTSCLQRLRDCRFLLLALLLTSGLYSLPELFIRSTITLGEEDICIISAAGFQYGLYVAFRLTMRHLIPAFLVIAAIIRPETKLSKRISYLFFGHLAAPCKCGDNGGPLKLPHECPNMQTAMLKANAEAAGVSHMSNGRNLSLARPDVIADSEPSAAVRFIKNGKVHTKLLIAPEDPHRRKYKLTLAVFFLLVTLINFALDISFQIQSTKTEANLSGVLATSLYAVNHLQQVGDPIIFLLAEFIYS